MLHAPMSVEICYKISTHWGALHYLVYYIPNLLPALLPSATGKLLVC